MYTKPRDLGFIFIGNDWDYKSIDVATVAYASEHCDECVLKLFHRDTDDKHEDLRKLIAELYITDLDEFIKQLYEVKRILKLREEDYENVRVENIDKLSKVSA